MSKKIKILLPGGGARGVFQAGFLQAVKEYKIPVDSITGTSVGALNAAMFISHYDNEDFHFWDNIWSTIKKRSDVFASQNFWYYILNIFGMVAIYNSNPLKKKIEKYVDFEKLKNSEIKFSCNSLDLRSGNIYELQNKIVVIRSEYGHIIKTHFIDDNNDILNGILASGSLPIVVEPVEHDGYLLIDGGMNNNVFWGDILNNYNRTTDEIWMVSPITFGVYGDPDCDSTSEVASILFTIQIASNSLSDYKKLYDKLNGKFVFRSPEEGRGPKTVLEFDSKILKMGFDHGYEEGLKVCNKFLLEGTAI
jgi:NTE family protein